MTKAFKPIALAIVVLAASAFWILNKDTKTVPVPEVKEIATGAATQNAAKATQNAAKAGTVANDPLSIEQQMMRSTDYLSFVETLEHVATHDARAARYLARVMKDCAFLQTPKTAELRRKEWAYLRPHMTPGSEKIRSSLGDQLIARCQNMAAQRPQLSEQAKRWAQRADELGDVEARVNALRNIKLPVDRNDATQMEALTQAAEQFLEMASRKDIDSNDALRLARFLTSDHSRALFNPLSPIGQLANQSKPGTADVIACALGADCTKNGYILQSGCLNSGLCSYATVQEGLRAQFMGSEELLRLQQLANEVAAMLRAGDMQLLTTPKG